MIVGNEDQVCKKFRLRVEDVKRKNVLTNFWGMDFTTDKLRPLVRKWQTLIEMHIDVKTTDNFTSRTFCIRFTKQRDKQVKRTCYAQSSQIREPDSRGEVGSFEFNIFLSFHVIHVCKILL
ncbi:hypothetical protein C5167_015654 [Papaver somniferum]|uniref:40S ribosomal protein S3a n=1 Tax=Papaver somniferum TaxID=3469 RepID=A0A4Y7JAI9_PAPSO|nr:hypothetical protein C5167_015654 [Papaver somniferum]